MTKRLLGAVAGIALTAALVAGCGPAPGAAATVDGDVIGQDEVAAVVEELSPFLAQPITPAQAVSQLVTAPTTVDVAADAGFGVSDDDARATLADLAEQQGVEPAEVSDATILVTRSILAIAGLQTSPDGADRGAEITDRVAELDVELNPRYGTWDGQTIAPATYEWIVMAEPDAA